MQADSLSLVFTSNITWTDREHKAVPIADKTNRTPSEETDSRTTSKTQPIRDDSIGASRRTH